NGVSFIGGSQLFSGCRSRFAGDRPRCMIKPRRWSRAGALLLATEQAWSWLEDQMPLVDQRGQHIQVGICWRRVEWQCPLAAQALGQFARAGQAFAGDKQGGS